MYKEASQLKLRVQTNKGLLSIEQLWDLSIEELDVLAVRLETEYKLSGKKSFIVKKSPKDKEIKLKFDIVLDILTSKVDEQDLLTNAREIKEHNQKVLTLIAEKQDEELKSKSVAELEKLLKK